MLILQVYLVAGGYTSHDQSFLRSTEILVEGSSQWSTVGNLFIGVWGLGGASIKNNVIMTGKNLIKAFVSSLSNKL